MMMMKTKLSQIKNEMKQNRFVLLHKGRKKIFCKILKKYTNYFVLIDINQNIYNLKVQRPMFYKNSFLIFEKQKIKIEFLYGVQKPMIKNFNAAIEKVDVKNLILKYNNEIISNYKFLLLCKQLGIVIPPMLKKWTLTSMLMINKNNTFNIGYKSLTINEYKEQLNEVINCLLCA